MPHCVVKSASITRPATFITSIAGILKTAASARQRSDVGITRSTSRR